MHISQNIGHMLTLTESTTRVHIQPGNQGHEGIVTELENGPFVTRKLGIYQGIMLEYQENQGKFHRKIFFRDNFSAGYIFRHVHCHFLKPFPIFSCYGYYVATWIFVVKEINV